MQVVFHTGAHCTDGDRLMKCLLRNRQGFADRGIAVPGPGTYRDLLTQSFRAMSQSEPSPDARDVLLDAILDGDSPERMILSNAYFFGLKKGAITDGQFYPEAPQRVMHLQKLFAGDTIQIHMGLRNPATFLPALLGNVVEERLSEFMGGHDLRDLRWSDCLNSIRNSAPDVSLTVWCNEDTPLIWGPIIRSMAGLAPGTKITGSFDLLAELMPGEGIQRFRAYLHKHPKLDDAQKQDVMIAFLEKFASRDQLEQEIDMPGWTEELVADLSRLYDEDIDRIRTLPGVTLIEP